jgi:hypothetical protein
MVQDWKEDSMSHVDEGTLHAYLDGELPSAERTALEAHLADCSTCRANLTEERALRERATAVLGSARPAVRPAPPLEQLRREPKRSRWGVRRSFAWAASIAVALGLGYYIRNPVSYRTTPVTPAQPVAVAQNHAASSEAEKAPAPRAAAAAQRQDSSGRQVARRTDEPAAGVALRDQGLTRAGPPSTLAVPAARPTANSLSTNAVTVDGVLGRAERAQGDVRAAYNRSARALVDTAWPVINQPAARSILGAEPVGLPGLATRKIRRSPGSDKTVVVEQALDASTVVQIFQRAASDGAPSDSTSYGNTGGFARERANRLARFVGRLRVEITGPLSADSLNRLLEQVAPLP